MRNPRSNKVLRSNQKIKIRRYPQKTFHFLLSRLFLCESKVVYGIAAFFALLYITLSGVRVNPAELTSISKISQELNVLKMMNINARSNAAKPTSTIQSNMYAETESKNPFLVVAIGTNPRNFKLRDGLRRTWVSWLRKDRTVVYRFFTELSGNSTLDKKLEEEQLQYGDMKLQDISGGYKAFSMRGQYQMRWALKRYPRMKYYLRVDDDSFLCYRKFKWELQQRPRKNFFWGKYFCKANKHCADENFMLFSADIPRHIIKMTDSNNLNWLHNNTMARNFGIWSQHWDNLTIFDDRQRFDVQQGLLTRYMHAGSADYGRATYARFCKKHMFAHWVKSVNVMEKVFKNTLKEDPWELPRITSNVEGCPDPNERTIRPLYAGHRW